MKYAPLTPEYDVAVADLIRTNLKAHHLDIPGTVYFDEGLDHLSTSYDAPGSGYYVLLKDGTVIGGIGLAEFPGFPHCCELQKLYLKDDAKGSGLGYKLISFIEEKARELGYKRMYLETHTNLAAAIHIYEKSAMKQGGNLMGTDERETLLQLLTGEDEFNAYKAMYEAAASALNELEDSYTEKRHDQTDSRLAIWSRLLGHICFQLNGADHSIVYEAGKLCGIISAFESLFRKEQQNLIIDAAIAELLSNSKPASKQVLSILYEAQQNEEWVPRYVLKEKSKQSQNSLSNIMKRLLRAQAVDDYKEGKEVSYRLTSAGIRYYEKNISPSMNDPVAMELSLLREKISDMQNTVSGLSDQMNRQTSTIGDIKRDLIYHLRYEKFIIQNNYDHSDYEETEFGILDQFGNYPQFSKYAYNRAVC